MGPRRSGPLHSSGGSGPSAHWRAAAPARSARPPSPLAAGRGGLRDAQPPGQRPQDEPFAAVAEAVEEAEGADGDP
eukprot:14410661-Alexandrium_andersonii.AAC.1